MSNAETFMLEARQHVGARTKTFAHRAEKMVWYTARDNVRSLPITLVTKIGAVIPFPGVGGLVNLAIEKGVSKVQAASKEKKRQKYRDAVAAGSIDVESLRKRAKLDAKDQKTLVDKIDGNLVKLKDSVQAVQAAVPPFVNSLRASANRIPVKDAWKLACALYEAQYYENKLQILVETLKDRLASVEEYLVSSRSATDALEDDLTTMLEELQRAGVNIVSQQNVLASSPHGYARLP